MATPAPPLLLLLLLTATPPARAAENLTAPAPAPVAWARREPEAEPLPEVRPPPPREVPRVLAAGATSLVLGLTVACPSASVCPDSVLWNYTAYFQNQSSGVWAHSRVSTSRGSNHCNSTVTIAGLHENTTYVFQARPGVKKGYNYIDWYKNTTSAPLTVIANGSTCPKAVSPVEDLLVHTASAEWLGLSWRPPAPSCVTRLEYRVRYYAALEPNAATIQFWPAGAFWSNASWAPDGDVAPCGAWRGRHCLVLAQDIRPHTEYIIHIQVRRTLDNMESEKAAVMTITDEKVPSPPQELRCVQAQASALELRWRCPLVPGGRLACAHVLVRAAADGALVQALARSVALRAEYSQRVEGLQPNTAYSITIWFNTTAGLEGPPASLEVWTSPAGAEEGAVTAWEAAGNPCRARHPHSGAEDKISEGHVHWTVPLAFVLGFCLAVIPMIALRYVVSTKKTRPDVVSDAAEDQSEITELTPPVLKDMKFGKKKLQPLLPVLKTDVEFLANSSTLDKLFPKRHSDFNTVTTPDPMYLEPLVPIVFEEVVMPEVKLVERVIPEMKLVERVIPEVKRVERVIPEVKLVEMVMPEVKLVKRVTPDIQLVEMKEIRYSAPTWNAETASDESSSTPDTPVSEKDYTFADEGLRRRRPHMDDFEVSGDHAEDEGGRADAEGDAYADTDLPSDLRPLLSNPPDL